VYLGAKRGYINTPPFLFLSINDHFPRVPGKLVDPEILTGDKCKTFVEFSSISDANQSGKCSSLK